MSDMSELRDVLNRIEAKLVAAGKMYSALNFAIWEAVMILYYLLSAFFGLGGWESAVYWIAAFGVAMYFSMRIWKRLRAIELAGEQKRSTDALGMLTGMSWGIGALIGWFIVPWLNLGGSRDMSLAIGLLSFITVSVLGMWVSFLAYRVRDHEMIPSFLIPALGIPAIFCVSSAAIVVGGFFVALGFTLTVILYLYSAFRVIEG